ncbi:hypothetical protein BU14_0070s0039 [Porphyra umbilicalis]|uniref:Aminotransferase class I/classII large domain-containing protein n=1 Tax=Porphyra umbilicalis TaxID=2786 RepID=A0A1X6PG83_PORUM|nr:hypothetical protein BU14_0070s0039 [Porphyra umbilicalis]|eukprot:OSX79864.1 hypothetical protein BU14_0070s0039 [Porphyra umbilicalis]
MDVMRAAAAAEATAAATGGPRVLHLEVGQPSSPAPAAARDAAAAALRSGTCLGYTTAAGDARLRAAIAASYVAATGVAAVSADDVVLTAGSSAAFVLAFLAAFDAGDRVATAVPGYPPYRHTLAALGVEVVPMPVDAATDYQPTVAHVEAAAAGGRLDGVIVASPSNPTGTVLPRAALADIADYCTRARVRLISDEIYHGTTFGGGGEGAGGGAPAADATCVVSVDPGGDAIAVSSYSKYHCMTGWRLGWLLVRDARLRAAVERLQQSLYICAPALAQVGAAALYDPPAVAAVVAAAGRAGGAAPPPPRARHAHGALLRSDVRAGLDAHVGRYRANAGVMTAALHAAGAEALVPPAGAFYIYAGVGGLLRRSGDADAAALCGRLLRDTGVAVTPGDDFDAVRGGGYVRLSVCGSEADVAEAAARLTGWAAGLGGGRRRPPP